MTPVKQARATLHRGAGGALDATRLTKPTFYRNLSEISAQEEHSRFKALVNILSVSYGCTRREVDALVKCGGLGTAGTNGTETGKKLVWV